MQRFLLLCTALLPLTACGDPADAASLKDDAYQAMAAGDSEQALAKFDRLLVDLEPSAPDYAEVAVARCQALAGVDGERAKTEFLELCEEQGEEITLKDYTAVAGKLQQAKAYAPAVYVVDAGVKRFPEHREKLEKMIEELQVKAEQTGDTEATSAIDSLGYLGDN